MHAIFKRQVHRQISPDIIFKQLYKGNVLFNDALNTFYLYLYGVGYMVIYCHFINFFVQDFL